jgi:hypothetical protein
MLQDRVELEVIQDVQYFDRLTTIVRMVQVKRENQMVVIQSLTQ